MDPSKLTWLLNFGAAGVAIGSLLYMAHQYSTKPSKNLPTVDSLILEAQQHPIQRASQKSQTNYTDPQFSPALPERDYVATVVGTIQQVAKEIAEESKDYSLALELPEAIVRSGLKNGLRYNVDA